ncbi:hypothetical protein ACWD04_33235 [Streptomyces sp. NPDC002911]
MSAGVEVVVLLLAGGISAALLAFVWGLGQKHGGRIRARNTERRFVARDDAAARELEAMVMAQQRPVVDPFPDNLEDLVVRYASDFAALMGRMPTAAEVLEEMTTTARFPKSLSMKTIIAIMDESTRMLAIVDAVNREVLSLKVDPQQRAAGRRVDLALRLLPAKEREHYRTEWSAEMAAMSSTVAAQFAANVLRHAPLTGISLRFAKLFGRQAA